MDASTLEEITSRNTAPLQTVKVNLSMQVPSEIPKHKSAIGSTHNEATASTSLSNDDLHGAGKSANGSESCNDNDKPQTQRYDDQTINDTVSTPEKHEDQHKDEDSSVSFNQIILKSIWIGNFNDISSSISFNAITSKKIYFTY